MYKYIYIYMYIFVYANTKMLYKSTSASWFSPRKKNRAHVLPAQVLGLQHRHSAWKNPPFGT